MKTFCLLILSALPALAQSFTLNDPALFPNITLAAASGGGGLYAGAVGYWKMDDGSGTLAADSSGNGNHAYLNGSLVWTTGHAGGALSFNTNNFAAVTNVTAFNVGTGDFSFCLWYKTPWPATGFECPISKDDGSGRGWLLYVNSAGDMLIFTASGTPHWIYSAVAANVWTHIVVTRSGGNCTVYLNGAAASTFTESGNVDLSGNVPIRIGIEDGFDWPAVGVIDQVAFFSRALTAPEVANLFAE